MNFCQLIDRNYLASWHHELIAQKLENALIRVQNGEKVRLILSIPPRHGKSQLASIYFPAWALGKYPEIKFIMSTYGMELSETMGMKTRDVIQSEPYQFIFPDVTLRPDQKAKAKWLTTEGGAYTAVGIGTAVTGTGANCFVGETKIITEHGEERIDTLFHLQKNVKVLSYNHGTKQSEFKRIKASRVIRKHGKQLVRVTTQSGIEITCTEDHRFFDGKRYKEIRLFKPGENVWVSELQGNTNSGDKGYMQKMWQSVLEKTRGLYKTFSKGNEGPLLFSKMFSRGSCNQEQAQMFNMQRAVSKKDNEVLQQGMQTITIKTPTKGMSSVQKDVSTRKSLKSSLLNGLLNKNSFIKNDRKESKLQARNGARSISERVSDYTKFYFESGRQFMCSLLEGIRTGGSSYRQQPNEQCSYKSCDSMQELSQKTSLIKKDTVSMVEQICDKSDVYDIEVEGNNNFFANGVLVHNCIILDDSHKDRAEAESETQRKNVWEYYRSTLYSRLEGFGAVIVIMQRWHTDDLVGRLLEEEERLTKAGEEHDEWEVIEFPAIAHADEYLEGRLLRKQGEPLWPSRYPLDVLTNIRQTVGVYNWTSQYQQQPISAETQVFHERFFRYYDEKDLQGKYLKYFTICDPAISQSDDADNTVVITMAKEAEGPNIYRIREDAGHYSPKETIDIIFKHREEYNSDVFIETFAYQKALKFAIEEEQKVRQSYFILKELKDTTKAKEFRIQSLIPLYERGVMFHKHSDIEYETELLQFPGGKHDDRIDAAAYITTAMSNSGHRNGKAKQFHAKSLFKRKRTW
jgi:hypothetical protein